MSVRNVINDKRKLFNNKNDTHNEMSLSRLSRFLRFWDRWIGGFWMKPWVILLIMIIETTLTFVLFSTLVNNGNKIAIGLYMGFFAVPHFILFGLLPVIDIVLLCFYYGKDEDDRLDLIMCLIVPLTFTVYFVNLCVGTRYINDSGWKNMNTSLENDPFILVWLEFLSLLLALILTNNCASVWSSILSSLHFYVMTVVIIPIVIAGCVTIVLEHKNTKTLTFTMDNKENDLTYPLPL